MNKGKTYRNIDTNALMSAEDYNCLSDAEKDKCVPVSLYNEVDMANAFEEGEWNNEHTNPIVKGTSEWLNEYNKEHKMTPEKVRKEIIKLIERDMPEFSKSCKQSKAKNLVFTQQAFSENECLLLGAAIKYAGYFDKDITILK